MGQGRFSTQQSEDCADRKLQADRKYPPSACGRTIRLPRERRHQKMKRHSIEVPSKASPAPGCPAKPERSLYSARIRRCFSAQQLSGHPTTLGYFAQARLELRNRGRSQSHFSTPASAGVFSGLDLKRRDFSVFSFPFANNAQESFGSKLSPGGVRQPCRCRLLACRPTNSSSQRLIEGNGQFGNVHVAILSKHRLMAQQSEILRHP